MYYRHYFKLCSYRRGLHAPLIARLTIFISDTLEYVYVEVASCLLVVYHVMNYEIPAGNKREDLRSPVISKLSGKLSVWQAGWQCVISDFNFVCW
jgi:hypothetical protein